MPPPKWHHKRVSDPPAADVQLAQHRPSPLRQEEKLEAGREKAIAKAEADGAVEKAFPGTKLAAFLTDELGAD